MTQRPPIACDMTDAPDTGEERLAEYARLFDTAYLGRERIGPGEMRWRLRTGAGIEAWARDLANLENTCCGFMHITVTVDGNEVIWHASTVDDPNAHRVLDLMYELPEARSLTVEQMHERFAATGVPLVLNEDGNVTRPATDEEIRGALKRPTSS